MTAPLSAADPNTHPLLRALRQCGVDPLPAAVAGLDGCALLDTLLLQHEIGATELARRLSQHCGFALLDLDSCRDDQLRPLAGAAEGGWPMLAFELDDGQHLLACSDPTAWELIERALFQAGAAYTPAVVEHDKLRRWQARLRAQTLPDNSASASVPTHDTTPASDSPALRLLQHLFDEAARLGASDLHLEPQADGLRIRLRVDGQLRETAQAPRALLGALLVRIKALSGLDITRTRLPQDGRMRQRCGGRDIEMRVSCVPTVHGEKVVLRLLETGQQLPALETLGYDVAQLASVQAALGRDDGLVLLTGPTGSGKTLSLYAFLRWLNRTEISIATAEDPVEIVLPGINQMPIQDRCGLGFADALRALLRQDPDVLMVGEIRDPETAEIAVQAAQTGHLVLSTLHTVDAPSALTRLRNIGIAPYNLAACLNLVCAQRLLRRLCAHCRVSQQPSAQALRAAGCDPALLQQPWQAYRAGRCDSCGGSGYRGRMAVHQLMPLDDTLRALILQHASTHALATAAAASGMGSLRGAALEAVRCGLTTLDEAIAQTPPADAQRDA